MRNPHPICVLVGSSVKCLEYSDVGSTIPLNVLALFFHVIVEVRSESLELSKRKSFVLSRCIVKTFSITYQY